MARLVLLVVLTVLAPVVQAAERLALFPFELINTSLEPTRPDEAARLQALLGQGFCGKARGGEACGGCGELQELTAIEHGTRCIDLWRQDPYPPRRQD